MLTEEQIQNLKQGDPIVIHATFSRVESDGDIWSKVLSNNGSYYEYYACSAHVSLPSEHGTSVPTPQHAPTRLFKKGDKVRSVKRRGHYFSLTDEKYAALILTVDSDEVADTRQSDIWVKVETEDDELSWNTDPVYLELVTPVEGLEPFGVRYSTDRDCAEVYHRRYKNTVAAFYCKCGITREQAEEHAEAECDRLNAEWRKEHGNG